MPLKNNKKIISEITIAAHCMPKSKASRRILHERAELISKESAGEKKTDETNSYIHFYLGNTEKYAIDYQYTKEVANIVNMTRLPCAPSYVAGIINRRGALITVLDLKQMLFNQTTPYQNEAKIIIVYFENITLGVLVDRIIGNKNYNKNTLDPSFPSENIIKMEYLLGLHEGEVALLNIPTIVSAVSTVFQGGRS